MNNSIVLIECPSPFENEPAMNPPLGLCYISALLKKHGVFDIRGLDFSLYKDLDYYRSTDYLKLIPLDADIYGISCKSPQFFWLKAITAYIRKYNPLAFIVVGGAHASTCPDDIKLTDADLFICGEGEAKMVDLIMGILPSITNLDDIPFPDRELFGLMNYKRTIYGERAVHIVTLRGCPYNCYFCDKVTVGRKVRYRSIENVLKEIDMIIDTYDIRSFVIYDDIFTLRKERVYRFCEEFKKRNITWRCWSRTDTITRDLLEIMKVSGLSSITFGVESGDDRILKNINKKTTREKNRNALLWCKELGIPVRCSLMYGNPGETMESCKNTVSLIKETQPAEWNLAVLSPIPGSEFWEHPEAYGIYFDKRYAQDNNYCMLDRFGDTGVGNVWISLETMTTDDLKNYLPYFISDLEKACPRKNIQDTIQEIRV